MPCLLEEDEEGGFRTPFLIPPREYGDDDRITVVLDLDETLVANHSQYHTVASNEIVHRPHLYTFLATLTTSCEVILWTASTDAVVTGVIEAIDPFGTYFSHVITRSPRWFSGVPYTKDLRLLGRNLDRTIIVENSPSCVTKNPENSIIVPNFYGYPTSAKDLTLLTVLEILEEIACYDGPRGLPELLSSSPHLSKTKFEDSPEAYFEVAKQSKPLRFG